MSKDNKKAPAEFGDGTGAKNQNELYNADKVFVDFANEINKQSSAIKSIAENQKTASDDAPDPHSPDVFDGMTPQERYEKLLQKGKGLSGKKFRNWALVVYPDSAYGDWRQRLESLHIKGFISPEHNKDKKPNGNPDKPHYHVLLRFSSPVPYKDLVDIDIEFAGIYGAVVPERVRDFQGYARYLCHLDNKNKVKYNPDDVEELGGLDYSAYAISQRDEEMETVMTLKEVAAFIKANKITNFFDLFDMAQQITSDEDYKLLKTIIHKTYFVNSLVAGNYQRVNADIATKEKEINDEYNNLKLRNQYRQAEREQLLTQIDDLKMEIDRLRGLTM